MTQPAIGVDVSGGQIQGIVGASSVVIENLTFYNRAPEQASPSTADEPIGPCPYPGLAYFGPGEAGLFFGRDAAIARLVDAVGRQSFTALVGASGSGKSSVVLAGVAPRLHSAGGWRFSHFRIGTELDGDPFLALARALTPLYVASESDVERLKNTKLLAASLRQGELTLRDIFADCRSRSRGDRILLIADQFEEAFTLTKDDGVRNRFIDVLLDGFHDPATRSDICLILTMRADFYGRALRHRPLADALQNHVENLGPMRREELQQAIVHPAEISGASFEPGLVETLLDAVQSRPGALPLLQFALREMWGRQQGRKITHGSYLEIGGVEGALAQRAETVFAGLTDNGRDAGMEAAFQRLFARLVTLGEGQEDTRRVVERTELGEDVWELAQRLADEENRLIVTNVSASRETAEVAHEALIHHWPRLVDWISRDRAFQSWLRQIKSNIDAWVANREDDGPLLRGGMLAQGSEWLARRGADLSERERDFVEASVALRRREEAEKEAARQAEIKRQQELAEAAMQLAIEQRQRATNALKIERGLDLAQRGWGVIFAQESQSNLSVHLRKLLDHRRDGAGSRYLELAYRPGETARQLLARYGAESSALDPIPYYLLIVGDPQQIPYAVQYELASNHAVGRICFEQPEQYAAYANNVVGPETCAFSGRASALLFGPAHSGDQGTRMSVRDLLQPIAKSFEEERQSWTPFDWSLTLVIKEAATKSRLMDILTNGKPPSILFIAGRGMQFDKNDARQKDLTGAILCAEFEGRHETITDEMFLSASDCGERLDLSGAIAFAFMPHGAGTSQFDDFDVWRPVEERLQLADHDMMSRLPMRWLGIPERGALAFIGHVDANYAFSITPPKTVDAVSLDRPLPGLFAQTLRQLMNGYTIGLAMDSFRRRFALNATSLVWRLSKRSQNDESRELIDDQLATLDIRNYVIIGDPAVSSPAGRRDLQ